MNPPADSPLFVAEEVLCAYPISTLYDSCPRYLFYALLLATCVTRWTGWLADVFLGAAATYAGTAAIQAFILVSSPPKHPPPSPITIPHVPDNTTLWSAFPALITNTTHLDLIPAALELDADAVLAIVVTAYLTFLPLQCWSRAFSHNRARYLLYTLWHILMLAGSISALIYWPTLADSPSQYTFCFPDLPPTNTVSSDGWDPSQRPSSSPSAWNSSIWTIFTNATAFDQLDAICFYPCFNTSQPLRQQSSLEASVASGDNRLPQRHQFWSEVVYSKRYIYSLIVLTAIINSTLLLFKILPYRSRLPSARVLTIWAQRSNILAGFKRDFRSAIRISHSNSNPNSNTTATATHPFTPKPHNTTILQTTRNHLSTWHPSSSLFTLHAIGSWMRLLLDTIILCALLFSIVVSPLTVVAFVVWIEYYIHRDGPSQETPRQVGQWEPLVAVGFLVLSAGVLKMKYWVASGEELDEEIRGLRERLVV
ncbi:integral membrane protein [Aspergillus heteromorphus CBS 117.55]|uniref:Integral membrane protein n=1 Tax=Aspergillus heteromorphus CBS 117.55 TaxID=1448321 RepID=A0A317V9G1_9EURO|nr:uncharacterized protein BO70DRAFT_432110 [Aspergillus heteromorphus CBS 117.55]PWY71033.1 integral membrane protein [Aspergillus heteromorphus CBS 117.55]